MVGHRVEQHVSLAVLAEAFALALTSHQNRFLQTFGAKPASGVGWEWQVFKRRVAWCRPSFLFKLCLRVRSRWRGKIVPHGSAAQVFAFANLKESLACDLCLRGCCEPSFWGLLQSRKGCFCRLFQNGILVLFSLQEVAFAEVFRILKTSFFACRT